MNTQIPPESGLNFKLDLREGSAIYSPAPNDDDMRKSDDIKRRDNKPGKPDPWAAPCGCEP